MNSARQFPRERRRRRHPAAAWLWQKLRQLFRKEPPEDPFAYVMAGTKPHPPYLRAAAVAELPED